MFSIGLWFVRHVFDQDFRFSFSNYDLDVGLGFRSRILKTLLQSFVTM